MFIFATALFPETLVLRAQRSNGRAPAIPIRDSSRCFQFHRSARADWFHVYVKCCPVAPELWPQKPTDALDDRAQLFSFHLSHIDADVQVEQEELLLVQAGFFIVHEGASNDGPKTEK